MNKLIYPGPRAGTLRAPASKSQAHRLLLCAALGREETRILCGDLSKDISATAACLEALGAEIREEEPGLLRVRPLKTAPAGRRTLPCGESGTTLRFLLPLAGALGVEADFLLEGRLPQRPLSPLDGELRAHGMTIVREGAVLRCSGRLRPGTYRLPGDVSSQFISGLLFALPLLPGGSRLEVTGKIESAGYIAMTEQVLGLCGVDLGKEGRLYRLRGGQRPAPPSCLEAEGDYSNAAFFLCMGALSEAGITVSGLSGASLQGDRAVLALLTALGAQVRETAAGVSVRRGELRGLTIDASPIPDLIPVLSVAAALAAGETRIVNAARLRLKESDRLRSTARMLRALGAEAEETEDGLLIQGAPSLPGGTVDACGDHRIAMSATAAACACRGPVTVLGAQCVDKSYPRFWEDFEKLPFEKPKGGSL